MTTVFHASLYDRFIEVQKNLRRKKLHGTNQGSNFLRGSFSSRGNVRAPMQFRREYPPPQHLERVQSSIISIDSTITCHQKGH